MKTVSGKSKSERGVLGWWCVSSVAALVCAIYICAGNGYIPYVSEGCEDGLTTSKTWCSFDKPSGFQFAAPCACVKDCDSDHFHVCRVNSTGQIRDFQALMHDTETVYLDQRLEVADVQAFLSVDSM